MARKRPAPYVPLSVHYADDEAIMDVGEDAELMYLRMLAYAGRTPNTEGFITRRVCLTRLGVDERPEVGPESRPENRLEKLLEVGLIAERDGGFQIVSWLRWNRSAAEMGQERASDRTRKARLTRSSPETGPESAPESGPVSDPGSGGQIQIQKQKQEKTCAAGPHDAAFEEFWKAYPSRGTHANPKKPAKAKWDLAMRKGADPQALILAASRLADSRRGQDPQHTPQAVTWLNQERWADEPVVRKSPAAMTNEELWA